MENVLKSDRFDAVFHVAGQVAMTTSIENPYGDFETNVMGTLNVLETIRKYSPETGMLFRPQTKSMGIWSNSRMWKKETDMYVKNFPKVFPKVFRWISGHPMDVPKEQRISTYWTMPVSLA